MAKLTLGIIGGGQLGSMLATAARKLKIKTVVFCDDIEAPAQKFSDEFVYGKYQDQNFKTIWRHSKQSGNFQDGPETSQCNFKGYAQKLSGWQCHDAMMVLGPLGDIDENSSSQFPRPNFHF